jgi:hypothetical protein
MISIQNDGSGNDLIFGEDAGDGTAALGDDQRKIKQARFLDAAMETGGAKAQRGCNTSRVVLAHADLRMQDVWD